MKKYYPAEVVEKLKQRLKIKEEQVKDLKSKVVLLAAHLYERRSEE